MHTSCAADTGCDFRDVVEILLRFRVQNVIGIQREPPFFWEIEWEIFQRGFLLPGKLRVYMTSMPTHVASDQCQSLVKLPPS